MAAPPETINDLPDDLVAAPAQAERASRAWGLLALRLRSVTPNGMARLLLVAGALWLVAWLIGQSWGVLGPFIFGLALAYLLLPPVEWLGRYMPRWAAILLVFFAVGLLLVGAWNYIVPPLIDQISALLQATPSEIQAQGMLSSLERVWSTLSPAVQQQISSAVNSAIALVRDNALSYVQSVLKVLISGLFTVYNLLSFALGLVIVPFFTYYVLSDYRAIRPTVSRILPPWLRADFWAVVEIVDRTFSSYLRGQLVLVLLGGVATFLGLLVLALVGLGSTSYTLLLSIFSGLTVLIPYVGFVLATAAAFVVGAFTSWQAALAMALVVLIVKQVVDTLIYPIVVGRSVHLHAAIVLVVLVVLSEFGVVWVILAPPVAAAARDLFRYAYGRLEDPPQPAGVLPPVDPAPQRRLRRR